jgi:glycosyltransferase involved in cell wall biosynthesis
MNKTKLIVTIPAYNEAKTIAQVIQSIPRNITGISTVEVLVWDDGSPDDTAAIAKAAGADYVFSNKKNLGLAKTFDRATKKAVELGADIIVNTDADNQYDQKEIPKLIKPILQQQADVVTGDRQVRSLTHMPAPKKYGNLIGSWTIRWLTGVRLNDASSGFRAYTKEAIQAFNLFSRYTYTHETLIQAHFNDLTIQEIQISFIKRKSGESRLQSKGIVDHIQKSLLTIIRTIMMYKAFRYLLAIGSLLITIGLIFIARFLYYYLIGFGRGHIQSLILAAILIIIGFNTIIMGVLADLTAINRKLITKHV